MMRNQKGFTLIELLIVVVIIGILAAIAIPKFSSTREKAYVSAMQSDLRNLQTAQEIYYSEKDFQYVTTGVITSAAPSEPLGFTASNAVTITLATHGDKGWAAWTKHEASPTMCEVYVAVDEQNEAGPLGIAKSPGVVACSDEAEEPSE